MDKRSALHQNSCIHFPGMDCTIEYEMGRGSNAIVYKARYRDAMKPELCHHVLLKELFPYHKEGKIYRAEDGLTLVSEDDEVFSMHRDSFLSGNTVHLHLLEKHPDRFSNNINTFFANGTCYSILDYNGGRTLQEETEKKSSETTLRGLVRRMIGIVDSLAVFHEMEYLHLDISPDNTLLIRGGDSERVELIDYNSVVPLRDRDHMLISVKQGFSAPEARMHNTAAIGYWTDLYSVTAVFYYGLTGRPMTLLEVGGIRKLSIDDCCFLKDVPPTVSDMVRQILQKGLEPACRKRYQHVEEMREALWELLDRIDGVGITHAALWEIGKRRIQTEVKVNPSLKYLTDQESLYPFHISAPGGQTIEDFCRGRGHVILHGQGGMGKTTLLMRTALRQTEKYRKDRPAFVYLSLFDYREGDPDFIHRTLLSRMKFKPETENYENARHSLDLLLQTPLTTKTGSFPVLCLLLDGYNEVAGDPRDLRMEIEGLAAMDGVRILVSSRGTPADLPFEVWEMEDLSPEEVQEVLSRNGLLMPREEELQSILTNALMLTLYVKACTENQEQIAIQTKKDLIDAYLNALLKKELDSLPDNSPRRWPLEVAFRCVYPLLADMEQSRANPLGGKDLLSRMEQLYRAFDKKAFLKQFPQWIGHTADIRPTGSVDEWYGMMIHDILWRQTGLLVLCEDGAYRLLHQDLMDALSPEGKRIRKILQRIPRRKRISGLVLGTVVAVALAAILWPRQLPEINFYDASGAVDALGYVQIVYTDLNNGFDALNRLPMEDDTPAGAEGFDKARAQWKNPFSYAALDRDGDGLIADDCQAVAAEVLGDGEGFAWNRLPFDDANYLQMAEMLDALREDHTGYIDVLESAYLNGSREEYLHCLSLVQNISAKEMTAAAILNHMVYSRRVRGLYDWENAGAGQDSRGAFERLDAGREFCLLLEGYAEERWNELSPEELSAATTEAMIAVNAARDALASDATYQKFRILNQMTGGFEK